MTTKKNGNSQNQPAGRNERAEEQHLSERKAADAAHEQAEQDIAGDADLSIHSPNDDLDEGETSRLGEDLDNII